MNIRKFIRRPVLVLMIFIIFTGLGVYATMQIPIDLFPEIEFPTISVITSYSSAGPEEVEKNVTRVLEGYLSNVSGLKKIFSTSSEGSSLIGLEFDWGSNLDETTNEIRDKIEAAKESLPDETETPRIFKFASSSMPILNLALEGDRSAEELREIADDFVQPRLEQINGVAQAMVQGGRVRAVRADISQNRLDAYNLVITAVAAALAEQNIQLGGGNIKEGGENYHIRTSGEFGSAEEIAEAVIAYRGPEKHPVLLKDIARVYSGYLDADTIVKINGKDGVYIGLLKQSGTNSVQTADAFYKKLPEINRELPRGVELVVVEDDTEFIRNSISNLLSTALEGAGLAMLILFLFLRNIRATLIIGVSIPVSILVTLLFMYFAGFTLNIMTLAGLILGVGLIVDSSIVILENIFQYRQKGADAQEASVSGGQEVISPIIASALTTVCVFVPIILFKYQLDMIGVILNDMMVTILITIVASLITAVVLVPVLAGRVFPVSTRAQKPLKNTILRRIDTFFADALEGLTASYKKALTAALRRRALVVAGSFLLFAASLASFALLRISLVPTMETESVTLFAELPAGKSLEDTVKVLEDMESIIRNEVTRYTHIYYSAGESGDGGLETKGENLGKLSVVLPPVRQQIEDTETVKALLRSRFADFPGVIFELENESISESEYPIDIAVMSDDLEKALAAAAAIERLIRAEIAEVPEVSRDVSDAQPEIQVVIDRKKAYALGLTTQAISREIRASIAGITASVFRAGGKEYDIFLVLQDADKNKVLDLNKIFVINNEGLRVPVSGFASLEKTTGPVDIKRENQSRTVHVQGTIAPGAEASVVTQKIREKIEERLILDGVRLEYGGDWADIQETGGKIIILLLLAVGLVFGVMAGQYESLKDPFINFFTIPLLFIGVIAIYLITGQAFSMFSAIGVVMLAGIVVNNGIVLVDYTNLLRARGAKVTDACIEGGVGRLRPVLMTSLTTILATIPMAFFPGESSQMIQPIGLTVIGGLTVSTVITLFLIPVIYSLLNKDKTEKAAKRRPKN